MPRTAKIELLKGRDGQWYWHRRASNGQITDQSEGYTRKDSAKRAAKKVHPGLPVVSS